MLLSLSGNRGIVALETAAFTHLRQLTKLDLSDCRISSLAGGAFSNLDSLERLYLQGNRLASVSVTGGSLPSSLHGIALHDNPWHCDCRLSSLRSWLATSNVPRLTEPVCSSPHRLQGFQVTGTRSFLTFIKEYIFSGLQIDRNKRQNKFINLFVCYTVCRWCK